MESEPVVVRRSEAIGDVLASTVVAESIYREGFDVVFQSKPHCHPVLRNNPFIKRFEDIHLPCHVNLDGAYENHPHKKTMSFGDIFVEQASIQLNKIGIEIHSDKLKPVLNVNPEDKQRVLDKLCHYAKPWIMINPRALTWPQRSIAPDVFQKSVPLIKGTCFWIGMDDGPPGIIDLRMRHFDILIHTVSCADVLVSPDTGPLHVACALNVPVVTFYQMIDPRLTIGKHLNGYILYTSLNCLNCQLRDCPYDIRYPPCQYMEPEAIANAVNDLLK